MRRFLIVLALAAAVAVAKPNLTGEWKANIAKCDFGQMPAPSSMVQKMTHEEPKLKVATAMSSDMGEMSWEASYNTDGTESVNKIRDRESKSIAKWEGDMLTIQTKGQFGDNEFTMTDKWTVSEDGKVLTINRHMSSSFGEGDQKIVLEKQ